MRVAVVGCGYVGLVSAVGLAEIGHEVVGIDSDLDRLALLERGEPPFAEPGVADALARALRAGALRFSPTVDEAADADVVLLCVQTPPAPSGAVDLTFIEDAARGLVATLPNECVVAVRSTVPPGTNARLQAILGANAAVVSNPEFLREGSALADFTQADRIVVGARDPKSVAVMRGLYAPIDAELIETTPETAELAKYASNAMLATLISFANELAHIAEATPSADVDDVLSIVHRDRRFRVGAETATIVSYLRAGCGYGGSCLPKDLAALTAYAAAAGVDVPLLTSVEAVNERQAAHLIDLAEQRLGRLAGLTVAVLGAAFKAGTDDLRQSPGVKIASALAARGAEVVMYDPLVAPGRIEAALRSERVRAAPTLEGAIADASACVVTTVAPEFDALPDLLERRNGRTPLVVDGRRLLAPKGFATGGYLGVGRGDA